MARSNLMYDPSPSDIIIPIMGVTGVGKSEFINIAAGRCVTPIGDSLESCTRLVRPVAVPYPNGGSRRVVFVDTPGFNDTWEDNLLILNRIADWLESSYQAKSKLSGIIFLHEITHCRIYSPDILDMLKKLCGSKQTAHAILVTTKWDSVEVSTGSVREQMLSERYLTESGFSAARFERTAASAWAIVDSIVSKGTLGAVQIQKDLVDRGQDLSSTDAALALMDGPGSHKTKRWNKQLLRVVARLFGSKN